MARRVRRRRRSVVRHSAPRRRRRRAVVRYSANPPRRRRRRHVVRHARRYRRNPGGGTGLVSTLKQGAKDGTLILIGQAAQGRTSALVARVLPVGGLPGAVLAEVGSAVAVTMAARKFAPGMARMIAGGAFANAVKHVVSAVSPSVGGLLGDGDVVSGIPLMEDYSQIGAYPQLSAYPDQQMGAYPGGGLGAADENVAYS